ncbi:hypothetical protein [Dendronalium sp. ChiSLP03b]|uniref:hypothetical protein n=1 Tax=Dendronalium sp. ChiSLP03b TaxID=3075381 RepID=UPI00391D05F8
MPYILKSHDEEDSSIPVFFSNKEGWWQLDLEPECFYASKDEAYVDRMFLKMQERACNYKPVCPITICELHESDRLHLLKNFSSCKLGQI